MRLCHIISLFLVSIFRFPRIINVVIHFYRISNYVFLPDCTNKQKHLFRFILLIRSVWICEEYQTCSRAAMAEKIFSIYLFNLNLELFLLVTQTVFLPPRCPSFWRSFEGVVKSPLRAETRTLLPNIMASNASLLMHFLSNFFFVISPYKNLPYTGKSCVFITSL